MAITISPKSILRRNDFIRETLRTILTSTNFHKNQKNSNDIFLFSSKRSGSTWLMTLLATEPGLRYVNEPLGRKFITKSILNKDNDLKEAFVGNKLFEIPNIETFRKYLDNPKHTKICSAYNIFQNSYHLLTNRRLFKIIHANSVVDIINCLYPENPKIILIRHPIANILSICNFVRRCNFRLEIEPFLQSDRFTSILNHEQLELIERILKRGTLLEQWALQWSLDQLMLFRLIKKNQKNVTIISYEQLILEPEKVFDYLGKKLNLTKTDKIIKNMNVPSPSTTTVRRDFISKSNKEQKISSWRKKIKHNEAVRIFKIIDAFGIDYYTLQTNLPINKYLI